MDGFFLEIRRVSVILRDVRVFRKVSDARRTFPRLNKQAQKTELASNAPRTPGSHGDLEATMGNDKIFQIVCLVTSCGRGVPAIFELNIEKI